MLAATLASAVCVFAGSAALGAVTGTPHDLRGRLGIDEECLPCHVPHSAVSATAGPVWNHRLSSATFTRKGQTVQLTGTTKLCMSCHDGVTAVGSLGNQVGNDPLSGPAAIGTDLTASHPVSVSYAEACAARPGVFRPTAGVTNFLEDGRVECGSCHEPHGTTHLHHYLRVTPDASALCRTCHVY